MRYFRALITMSCAILALNAFAPAHGDEVHSLEGEATAIGPTHFSINGVEFYLSGVVGPNVDDVCLVGTQSLRPHTLAERVMPSLLKGQSLVCILQSGSGAHRVTRRCYYSNGVDVAEEAVAVGLLRPNGEWYKSQEHAARIGSRGFWGAVCRLWQDGGG
jgi:hypothetical protein